MGEPDDELKNLLDEVESIQQSAIRTLRAGISGGDFHVAGEELVRCSPHANYLEFIGHGMGLATHEVPRLTSAGPIPYPGDDAHRPLEAGMVISVETTMKHPRRSFIKLEDTVAVTVTGFEIFGAGGRGLEHRRLSRDLSVT
jgi:Xaa-Pro aminopeptidase